MAIKKSQVVTVDLTANNATIAGKNKVAINFTGLDSLEGIDITTDGKNLFFKSGENLIATVTNAGKIKSTKFNADSAYTTDVIAQNVLYTGAYAVKRGKVTGSGYNDSIVGSELGYIVPASGKGLTISGGNGNDTLSGTSGMDTFTGGKGTNTIVYKKGDGNDVITLTNGENLVLNLDCDEAKVTYEYSPDKKDLLIYTDNTLSEYITLKNFASKDILSGVTVNFKNGTKNIDLKAHTMSASVTESYTGTWMNDSINAAGVVTPPMKKGKVQPVSLNGGAGNDTITGSDFKDNIVGGAGDDLINGSLEADTISGGIGHNTVKYSGVSQLAGDVINLTKKESLTIDISAIAANGVTYAISGKNLVITVQKGAETESFTISNFAKKDVTTADGAVNLKISNTKTINLREALYLSSENSSEIKTSGKNFTGTWLAEEIDASAETLYKDKKKTKEKAETDKGLKLNGGGGNDVLYGTKYSDTISGGAGNDSLLGGNGNDLIKGGAGDDTIIGGVGNDKLYGEAGNNVIQFALGCGNDTVFSGKGTDTLKLTDISISDISFIPGSTKKTLTDLVIKISENDSVTIKNYYNVKKGTVTGVNTKNSVKFIET
ncbi:hypothetical protein II906_12000, partial [bacterium]|nr:hypothetical protein [bacterium]